ncbi:hypothetical protein BC831DRAFT_455807 [Entophlyctis helioformis]|nr:hypothetical protein BC831DRAFT_455807 [Entophlyctis helioformis]
MAMATALSGSSLWMGARAGTASSAAPAPFLLSLSDSIRIVLDEKRVEDALELIQVFLDGRSYPDSAITRQLLNLLTKDAASISTRATAQMGVLYRQLIASFGPVVLDGVWKQGGAVEPGHAVAVALGLGTGGAGEGGRKKIVTFWSMVRGIWEQLRRGLRQGNDEPCDKARLMMDLMLDAATAGFASASASFIQTAGPTSFADALVGNTGRRSGLPTGINEAMEMLMVAAQRCKDQAIADETLELTAKWIHIIGQHDFVEDGSINFHLVLAERAGELVKVIAKTVDGVSPNPASSLRNPKDQTSTHCDMLMDFVRSLPRSEFMRRFCDHTLVTMSSYPKTVRHLIRGPPGWSKISQVHLQSKPARPSVQAARLHALLVSRVLEGVILSADERDELRVLVAAMIEEMEQDLDSGEPPGKQQGKGSSRRRSRGKAEPDWVMTLRLLSDAS